MSLAEPLLARIVRSHNWDGKVRTASEEVHLAWSARAENERDVQRPVTALPCGQCVPSRADSDSEGLADAGPHRLEREIPQQPQANRP